MGMYTELYLAIELSKETPKEIIEWCGNNKPLKQMENTRLKIFGYCSSYYFDGLEIKCFKYDDISNSYYLTTRFDIKNYDKEIQKMLSILEPYITSNGHIGHIRYEEDDKPTLLYYKDNKIIFDIL